MTTPDEIVISTLPGDRRAAWLAAGRLIRFFHQGTPAPVAHGDLFLGRVSKRTPALGITFVDLAAGTRAGVLMDGGPRGATDPKRKRPSEGDAVLVQISRAPTADKGAKLTRRISLCGRLLVLEPDGGGITPARGLARAGGCAALAEKAAVHLPKAHGWVLRPAAGHATAEDLAAEAAQLVTRWQAITGAAATTRPPARLLAAMDAVLAAVRDGLNPALARIIADDASVLAEIRQSLPAAAPLLRLHRGAPPLFDATAVNEQLDAALSPAIALAGGGRVTIAETEALVAIDVDAGATQESDARRTAAAVNCTAAAAIAEAILLRELAGVIVIDFVPMRSRNARAGVLDALRAGLADDDRQTDIAGFTSLGLVEIRRAREGPSLRERLSEQCPACRGTGRARAPILAGGDALRALLAEADAAPHRPSRVVAAGDVLAALQGPLAPAMAACAVRLGRPVAIALDSALATGCYRLELVAGNR